MIARLVLGWVTTGESLVLYVLFCCLFVVHVLSGASRSMTRDRKVAGLVLSMFLGNVSHIFRLSKVDRSSAQVYGSFMCVRDACGQGPPTFS
ncbi:hypothetical protein GE09DRAFT_562556 [Coniochaeta sp. 2T2.1]|nr:hypothetical protein GE09DRAFT_562556 [Coniochaeta sp. 2T2.1]